MGPIILCQFPVAKFQRHSWCYRFVETCQLSWLLNSWLGGLNVSSLYVSNSRMAVPLCVIEHCAVDDSVILFVISLSDWTKMLADMLIGWTNNQNDPWTQTEDEVCGLAYWTRHSNMWIRGYKVSIFEGPCKYRNAWEVSSISQELAKTSVCLSNL